LLALYRLVHLLLPRAWRPLPRPPASPPDQLPATGSLALFRGCIAGPYEAGLRAATARLCSAAGAQLALPSGQVCCGALHAHAGDLAAASTLGARNRTAFAGARTVLTLASGCHDSLAQALRGQAVTHDALDWLATHAAPLSLRPCRAR